MNDLIKLFFFYLKDSFIVACLKLDAKNICKDIYIYMHINKMFNVFLKQRGLN